VVMAEYRDSIKIEKCVRCGYSEFKEILCVHHVDEDRNNDDESNKIVLCNNCHNSLHYGSWSLKEIGIESDILYSRGSYYTKKLEKVAKGEAVWNGRGKDKKKRKTEGYLKRWANREA
jgi:Zn ribbon nucleic-acid-binding protein